MVIKKIFKLFNEVYSSIRLSKPSAQTKQPSITVSDYSEPIKVAGKVLIKVPKVKEFGYALDTYQIGQYLNTFMGIDKYNNENLIIDCPHSAINSEFIRGLLGLDKTSDIGDHPIRDRVRFLNRSHQNMFLSLFNIEDVYLELNPLIDFQLPISNHYTSFEEGLKIRESLNICFKDKKQIKVYLHAGSTPFISDNFFTGFFYNDLGDYLSIRYLRNYVRFKDPVQNEIFQDFLEDRSRRLLIS